MRALALAIVSSVCALPAFAQLDPFTLTVTASRSITFVPDQTTINVTVYASPSLGLNDVLALVQRVGITKENLSYVYTSFLSSSQQPQFAWTFTVAVPFSSMKDTLSKLAALQGKLGTSLSFSVAGLQVSPQAQAAQPCPMAALVSDATTQAQALSQAAGFGLGPISSITDGSGGTAPAVFAISAVGLLSQPALVTNDPASCTIVVKFKLIQL